jgi:hypothetical protein
MVVFENFRGVESILFRSTLTYLESEGVPRDGRSAPGLHTCRGSLCCTATDRQIFDLRTELLTFFFIRSDHRLVRAGIGFDLRAARRRPTHFQRTQRDRQNPLEESSSVFKWILRKSDMVRTFG